MAKKKKRETPNLPWNFSDFKWCIDNDFQVYPIPIQYGYRFKIAIRRGGISTEGKDFHRREDGVLLTSKERSGVKEFRNIKELADFLPNVYRQLREQYGR